MQCSLLEANDERDPAFRIAKLSLFDVKKQSTVEWQENGRTAPVT